VLAGRDLAVGPEVVDDRLDVLGQLVGRQCGGGPERQDRERGEDREQAKHGGQDRRGPLL
jgi:hypothetical protein